MPKRWSKLQNRLYNLMSPIVKFQIHCVLYEMNSNDGYHVAKLPRYFITTDKEIVFDYPKDFDRTWKYGVDAYPWDTDISEISDLIEEYIQCPEKNLMNCFEKDRWGITNVLRVCDRRVGKRRLRKLKDNTDNEILLKIINERLNIEYKQSVDYNN